jgi:predicted Rossmann-fold nucleotide-binding protein
VGRSSPRAAPRAGPASDPSPCGCRQLLSCGFGTLDELFESLTLIQTATIRHFPAILLGEGEWDGLLDWLRARALADGRIGAADLEGLQVVAEPQEVCEIVQDAYARQREHVRRQPRRRAGA